MRSPEARPPTTALLVALTLGALSMGCAHPVASSLRNAVEAGAAPEDLHVGWDDYHPSWGGDRIDIRGDGTVDVLRLQPGQDVGRARVLHGQASAERLLELVRVLVDVEAWEQRVEGDAEERVDDRKAVLVIETAGGRSRIWEWASDLEVTERLLIVRRLVARIAREALGEAF